jgi:pilus assembly protein TadC
MSKPVAATNNKQDRELDKLTWALAKADMQAIGIRLDALIKVGSETNLSIVRRVVGDLKQATDTLADTLGLNEPPAPEAQ